MTTTSGVWLNSYSADGLCQAVGCVERATCEFPSKDRNGEVVWWVLCDTHAKQQMAAGVEGLRRME
jgi:hypothetical protein